MFGIESRVTTVARVRLSLANEILKDTGPYVSKGANSRGAVTRRHDRPTGRLAPEK